VRERGGDVGRMILIRSGLVGVVALLLLIFETTNDYVRFHGTSLPFFISKGELSFPYCNSLDGDADREVDIDDV
jgi:hypothetical protein